MNEKYKKASMDHLHLILSLISMLHVERYTEILQFVMDTFWKLSQFLTQQSLPRYCEEVQDEALIVM